MFKQFEKRFIFNLSLKNQSPIGAWVLGPGLGLLGLGLGYFFKGCLNIDPFFQKRFKKESLFSKFFENGPGPVFTMSEHLCS